MQVRCIAFIFCLLTTASVFSEEDDRREDLFLSTPDQIATLTSEPDYLVGGLISPLSGHPVLRQTDLIVKGAQEIVLSRTYIPPYMPFSFPQHKHNQDQYEKKHFCEHLRDHYKGWQFYPHLRLQFESSLKEIRLAEPSGVTLDFRLSGPNFSTTSLASPLHAITNTAGDIPSGKYDPRNTRISLEGNNNRIIVHAADGAVRFYEIKARTPKASLYIYFLAKEILPNGKVLKYHYNEKAQPDYVESQDPKERYTYASMLIMGSPWDGNCHFTSSSGMSADYSYQKKQVRWKISEQLKKGKKYQEECNFTCPPVLTSVSSPFYRHESLYYCSKSLLDTYFGKRDIFNVYHASFGKDPHYRVHTLFLPVGQHDGPYPAYLLSYQPPIVGERGGTTTVKNSDGTSLIYHFCKNLLTTAIQYFGQDGGLKKEKLFSWDDKHWLKFIEMKDAQNLLYRRSFEYDRFGNPTLETFTGDLTGEGNQESYTIRRAFSEEGRNLLLREESEEGKVICFSYLPNTNLVTSKLTKDGDQIILREFSVYDDCNNLIQHISDDGASEDRDNLSNVTQRTLTVYTLRQSAPFFHMAEWIEEKYWESGTEKSLKKSHLIYDQHGNIAQEEVYDAEGMLAYTIYKTYNERGDILSETNSLGQQAAYTYDARGLSETTTNFSHRLHTTFHHDTKGRLLQRVEKGDDGVVHVTSSEYDPHDRRIQKRDPFQNSTHYTYDPLLNEVSKTDFPPIASLDGQAVAVTTGSGYDSFGRELTKTDANGSTTTYRYNAYGSPIEIFHANEGRELFRYEKNGKLISHTDPDGLTIQYKNDVLGRALSKTYLSAEGSILAEETFSYNGFHVLSETDKEGHVKQYSYDGAGRKIREEFCGRATDFSYDSLGRLATICKHNGENTLFIHYKRDLEGQILEERKTDSSGHTLYKIAYTYDADGNRETVTRYIHGKEAVDAFTYDSFSRLIEKKDAEGYVSRTVYDESYTNSLGQKVLQILTTDPRDIMTIETQNALARTVKKETLNPQRATISCQEMTHDPQGNLLYQRDHVYENDLFRNTQTIHYTYTPDNRIASLTRAFGTQDARTIAYTYTPSGKTKTKTLPDGIMLSYSYHPLGFLSTLNSSDGAICHTFEYDRLGYLKYASDENQHIAIKREVDPFGNVIQEMFPFGLEVKKNYDDLNRLITLKMGNQGEVLYTYDPLFLREVTRTSSSRDILYTHIYKEYDEDGNLISENLIGNLGQVVHATDSRGQKESISSPYFSQKCSYDMVENLISNVVDGIEHHYSYDEISQLSSEKSLSQSIVYLHDSLHNRIWKDGKLHEVNDLNELLSVEDLKCSYDLNGNQILKQSSSEILHFNYDPLNRLIEVSSENRKINFVYDPLGRRLSKMVHIPTSHGWNETVHEHYLYNDENEIGAFASYDAPKNLRVLGLAKYKDNPATVGIEVEGRIFAPLLDVQKNIRRLIDLNVDSVASSYDFTAFGEALQTSSQANPFNPWLFASKRFDPELGLIYFGKRYYDSQFGRWLTTDPAEFIDSFNLYQYVLNNPFRYQDPRGESLLGFLGGIGQILVGGAIMATGVALEIATFGGYTFALGFHESAGLALMTSGCALAMHNAKDVSYNGRSHHRTRDDYSARFSKRHTPNQEALSDLVKESGKKGVSNADADTLLDWAKEYDFPNRDDRGKPHWDAKDGMDHIHLGPKHIPVNN